MEKFKDWKVLKNGDMSHSSGYDIEGDRLKDNDWILHLSSKNWIDMNTFISAYFKACENKNLQEVKIKTYHNK
jgi:hypothetical protein